MASSRKSAPADPAGDPAATAAAVVAAVSAALREQLAPAAHVAVALSGGLDSMSLLDAMASLRPTLSIALSAVHIHHGLSPNADRWAAFCTEQCALRNIPLTVHRLSLQRSAGESLEALARVARYREFAALDVDAIALAHHADDQAETVLLQLLRGAGPLGLAAMPDHRAGRPALLRPLLTVTRADLAAYALTHGLAWVSDESNANTAHRRNRLRNDVVPLLQAHFPGYPHTLGRAARHQAEAAGLLDELAELDASGSEDLTRERLAALSTARARNLLRWFLRREGMRPPSEAQLGSMLGQLLHAADDAKVRIAHDGSELGIHRGRICVHAPSAPPFTLAWHGELELRVPGGTLSFESVSGSGLGAAKLASAPVILRSRTGGERIQLAANRPHHAVKKLLQQSGLPAWERDALPLIWCGNQLAAIPCVGVAVAFQPEPGAPGWRIHWHAARRSRPEAASI